MSLGAEACEINISHAVEVDIHASSTFSHNHPGTHLLNTDIRSVNAAALMPKKPSKEPVVLFGGPPCQGFSTSNQNNRNFENENNWLFKEYLRLVSTVRPDWIVFENVKGLMETENGFFLDAVLTGINKAGYTTSHFILNSADYGVPQKRNRLFIIGSLHGVSVAAPKPTVRRHRTVREAIEDLPELENGSSPDIASYSKIAINSYARTLRNGLTSCSNNLVTSNAKHIVERYSHIPQGGNWANIPKKLMRNYADVSRCHTGIYRRLREDEPSVVIGNYRKNMLIHPWVDRGLSVREAARLQSFPDNFKFFGSIGFQQQQVGNAVPPLLAQSVFACIT